MRKFASIVWFLLLACPVVAQDAVRTLAQMPANSEMIVTIEKGAALLEVDDAMLKALAETGWLLETRPAFDVLADRLGAQPREAFAKLMGHRATLVIRPGAQGPVWGVITEVDAQTARALPGALDAKPLRVTSGLPVHGLERRSFEIAVTPTDPNTNTAHAIIAPARASELFNTLVQIGVKHADAKASIDKGAHAILFAEPMEGSIAIYWSPPAEQIQIEAHQGEPNRFEPNQPRRAMLAVLATDERTMSVRLRAVPHNQWIQEHGELEPLPKLTREPVEGEVLSVWSQRTTGIPALDAMLSAASGQAMWSMLAPAAGVRGLTITRGEHTGTTVRIAARSPDSGVLLARADGVLTNQANAQSFEGQLPSAMRRSSIRASAVLGAGSLTELAWWAVSRDQGEQGWLMAVGTDGPANDLEHQAKVWTELVLEQDGTFERTLTVGRARPTALIPVLAQLAAPPEIRAALAMLGVAHWRVYIDEGDVLNASLRIEMVK